MSERTKIVAERGPHPVGVVTTEIESPAGSGRKLPVDVWYPAAAEHAGADAADRSTAEHSFGQLHRAIPQAAPATPAAGGFPLLGFSHGNSGLRQQSTFLTTHLASWGCVVVSPDHVGNTFFEMLDVDEEARVRLHREARERRPLDLRLSLDHVLSANGEARAWPSTDPQRIGVLGHSFGGWTACKIPRIDARVRAVCGLAPASEKFVGRKAFESGELPLAEGIHSLLIAGREDVLVDLETSVQPFAARLSAATQLLVIDAADHFHFCDGVPVLHENHYSRPRPNQARPTRPLGELLDEARMHRIVNGLVTAFFLKVFDGEREPGIGSAELEALDSAVSDANRAEP